MSLQARLPPFPEPPLPVAVSECLTGAEVRYDGAHKRSSMPHDLLDPLFEYRPICPEVGIGLGVPRETIRLVGASDAPRALQGSAGVDVTARLSAYARARQPVLDAVDGYIFMKNSPSCGLYRVKVSASLDAPPAPTGRGVFAAEVTTAHPDLPVEEGGRLFDPALAENFVMRTFVHAHWRRLLAAGLTPDGLIAFHSAYKYLLMAHSVSAYRALGRCLANLAGGVAAAGDYFAGLMQALARPATRGGHVNVLSHLAGYAKRHIDSAARRELADVIESYRRGEVPLLAPLTLLKHHLGTADATYALEQIYLNPHPAAAGLRRNL